MITCQDCKVSQPEGTLFCSECGCYLIKDAKKDTVVLPFSDFAQQAAPSPLSQFNPQSLDESQTVTFVIPGSRRRLPVEINNQIHVGRADIDSNTTPELDLSNDNGAELGVSRMHAVIQTSEQGLVIIDLGSTNGTSLNNSPLSPQSPYLLNNGDEIRFGELLVHILF